MSTSSKSEESGRAPSGAREREDVYRTLIESLPDIVTRVDREFRHLFASENILEATGVPASRFNGKTARELGFPEGLCRFWEQGFRSVFETGQPFEAEFMFEGKTGPAIHHWRVIPEPDPTSAAPTVLAVSRDITAHRRAQENYRTLFREMLDGYALHEIICDNTDRPVDYRFLAVNPAFEEMTGLGAENVLGKRVLEVLPDTEPFWIETYGRVALTGEPAHFEHFSAALDKHFEVRSFRPAPRQFVSIFTDVTQRRRAEDELQKSEAKFRAAFFTSPDAVNLNRMSDGLYLEVNDGFLRIMGYDRHEVLGRTSLELNIWDNPADRERLVAGLRANGYVENLEAQFRRKDGKLITGLMSARVIVVGNETVILSITRDITEFKRAEEQQKRLEAQLQQAMKMEAVGRLAGGVAHDFNNLLTGILGYTDIVSSSLEADDPLIADLDEIRKAAESAATLTRQLLAFSRKQLIEPRVLDLNDLIESLRKMLVRLIGEDIALTTFPGGNLGAVKVDPGQFQQILVNLAVNARDAMPGGGRIVIETANIVLDEEYCRIHSAAKPGPHVLLAVSDTGHGMTDEVKQHLFEPFFTTKPKGAGTGLGLATIYGTVVQADGSVEVYSEVGRGTTVKIYLPVVDEKPGKLSGVDQPGPVAGKGEVVLVVEDEPVVRELAVRFLQRLGYRVINAPDGEQALELIRDRSERIDILLTDVVMPGMNGRQLAERVVAAHPETKVLYASGYTENAIAHHGVIDENLHFLGKPYTLATLSRKIREVLDAR